MKTVSTAETTSANDPVRLLVPNPTIDKASARTLFDKVVEIENTVYTVTDLLRSLYLMTTADTISDERDQTAFQRLIFTAEDAVAKIEGVRGELFHGLHPFAFGAEVNSLREEAHG